MTLDYFFFKALVGGVIKCSYFFFYEQVTKLPFKDKCNIDYFSSGYKKMVSSEESPKYHHFCYNNNINKS